MWYKFASQSLNFENDPIIARIEKISNEIASAAQSVYDSWDPNNYNSEEEYRDAWGVGGICNDIAKEIAEVVKKEFPEYTVLTQNSEGEHCNHEFVQLVIISEEAFDIPNDGDEEEIVDVYDIDIPYSCYEICNSFYEFTRIKDVKLSGNSVSIHKHRQYLADIREY